VFPQASTMVDKLQQSLQFYTEMSEKEQAQTKTSEKELTKEETKEKKVTLPQVLYIITVCILFSM